MLVMEIQYKTQLLEASASADSDMNVIYEEVDI